MPRNHEPEMTMFCPARRNFLQRFTYAARVSFAGLMILLTASPSGAQERERGPILLTLPASTRALGLGGSYPLAMPDAATIFHHPGNLDRASGFLASIQRYGSSSTLTSLAAGTSWYGGAVAIAVQHLSYGANAEDPASGQSLLRLPSDHGSLRDDGDIAGSELVVSAGYGRTFMGLRMGLVGKLVENRFGPRKASTASFDLGIATSPGDVVLGLALQNLGPDMTIGGEDIPLPLRVALGASTRAAPVGPLDIALASSVLYEIDGDAVPTFGIETAYWPVTGRTFFARIGVRHLPNHQSGSPMTFGGGFQGDNIVLNYAYEGFDSGSPAHRFSLGWR